MRLLISTVIALVVSAVFFMIIKLWGASQPYIAYSHPLYETPGQPLVFQVLTPDNLTEGLKQTPAVYLNIAVTRDQKLIVIDRFFENEKQIEQNKTFKYNNKNFSDLTSDHPKSAVLLEQFKDQLQGKKIIFNMQDNPLQSTIVFANIMKILGMEDGHNFIFVSPYDPPAKDLKSFAPTYLFGSTEPEILKIKALESLRLIEAAQFRADIVIHPLTYYKQPFFTENLIQELKKRHKKFIVGPLQDDEVAAALALNPFGIIKK